nr:dynein intermediate chain 2, ciliary-like [Procambarus clarkii]
MTLIKLTVRRHCILMIRLRIKFSCLQDLSCFTLNMSALSVLYELLRESCMPLSYLLDSVFLQVWIRSTFKKHLRPKKKPKVERKKSANWRRISKKNGSEPPLITALSSLAVMHGDFETDEEDFGVTDDAGDPITNSREQGDLMCEDVITQEELDMLDSQVNPFNYSERVSQTTRRKLQNTGVQTDPPPGTSYSGNVGFSVIYDAYQRDYDFKLLNKQKELDKEQGNDTVVGDNQRSIYLTLETQPTQSSSDAPEKVSFNIPGLHLATVVVERMVSQNIFDDIIQDFMYWEDGGDEYHPLEGSLLPLWKFTTDDTRSLIVSDVCWSPVYADLFSVSYTTGQ